MRQHPVAKITIINTKLFHWDYILWIISKNVHSEYLGTFDLGHDKVKLMNEFKKEIFWIMDRMNDGFEWF